MIVFFASLGLIAAASFVAFMFLFSYELFRDSCRKNSWLPSGSRIADFLGGIFTACVALATAGAIVAMALRLMNGAL